jgi:hypothetical protein
VIGQQLGPFHIEAELGSGGMGRVYLAVTPEGHKRALCTPTSCARSKSTPS